MQVDLVGVLRTGEKHWALSLRESRLLIGVGRLVFVMGNWKYVTRHLGVSHLESGVLVFCI